MGNSDSSSRDWFPDSFGVDFEEEFQEFMNGGGCKESHTAYQDCAEEAEKKNGSVRTKCYPMLEKCMEAHSEYYRPILAAQKAADEAFQARLVPSAAGGRDVMECKGDVGVEEELKKFCELVEGGDCKESFTAALGCLEEAEKNNKGLDDETNKCDQHMTRLMHCVHSHSVYHHPLLAIPKAATAQLRRDLKAFLYADLREEEDLGQPL